MSIPFTQFLRPNGERREVTIVMADEIEDDARAVIRRGARFEIEELSTGIINMDCQLGDVLLAQALCANGPEVVPAVTRLVREATEKLETLHES